MRGVDCGKFNEMSTIGPLIDRQGKLQRDYVTAASFKGAHNVRNGDLGGAAAKAALIESGGYMFNTQDKLYITGYHKLGNLGGAATKAALIESGGYMFNEQDKLRFTGYHKLGNLAKATLIESGGATCSTSRTYCASQGTTSWALWAPLRTEKFTRPLQWESIIHLSASLLYATRVRQSNGSRVTLWFSTVAMIHSNQDWQDSRRDKTKGLKLHVCKKCHRTAQNCKGGLAAGHQHAATPAASHANMVTRRLFRQWLPIFCLSECMTNPQVSDIQHTRALPGTTTPKSSR